jgi:hypothetical protein
MNGDERRAALCPVCRARFRGAARCSRCGADLTPLILLIAHAYRFRQQARQALCSGNRLRAFDCAEKAQHLHATLEGNLLQWVCAAG